MDENNYAFDLQLPAHAARPLLRVLSPMRSAVDVFIVDGTTSADAGNQPEGIGAIDWLRTRIEKEFDNFGNEISSTQGDFSKGGWGFDKKEKLTEYIRDVDTHSSHWRFLPNRVVERAYTQSENFPDYLTCGQTRIYYDNQPFGSVGKAGLPTKEERSYDEVHSITTRKAYDRFGNLQTEWDGRGFDTEYEYDSIFHSHLVEKWTPVISSIGERLLFKVRYDELMRPIGVLDSNGPIRDTVYDVFGRPVAFIDFEDSFSCPTLSIEYHDADDSQIGDGTPSSWIRTCRRETRGQNSTLDDYTYFDGFGKVIQKKLESIDEHGVRCWKTEDTWVYLQGRSGRRLHVQSIPYYSAAASFDRAVIVFEGDEFRPPKPSIFLETYLSSLDGRVQKISEASGAMTTILSKHSWIRTIDPLCHLRAQEVLLNTNERRDHRYLGEYPNVALYATTTTVETFEATSITDTMGNVIRVLKDWLGRKRQYHDPDMGLWLYEYDDNGNLIQQTDAKGQVIAYSYDQINRLVRKEYPIGIDTEYSYDQGPAEANSKGRLSSVIYASGSDSFQYDRQGRVTSETRVLAGQSRTFLRSFDPLGRIVQETYPDGERVKYNYDCGGRLERVSGTQDTHVASYVADIGYSALDKIIEVVYGNGVRTKFSYYDEPWENDPGSGAALTYQLKGIQAEGILCLGYKYDLKSNVLCKESDGYPIEFYRYDDLERLTEAESALFGLRSYIYDAADNLVRKEGNLYSYNPSGSESVQPHAAIFDGKYHYEYDSNGNCVRKSSPDGYKRVINYDYENRITAISQCGSYAYDAFGRRVLKAEGGLTTYCFFPGYEEEYERERDVPIIHKYYFAGRQRVAQWNEEDGISFFHADRLGSLIRLTDASGKLVKSLDYEPYGTDLGDEPQDLPNYLLIDDPIMGQEIQFRARKLLSLEAVIGQGSAVTLVGSSKVVFRKGARVEAGSKLKVKVQRIFPTGEGLRIKYKFNGQEQDSSGLYYYGARYYDPELGRFIQPDTLLDGLNRYAYCRNNPVNYIDPTGHLNDHVLVEQENEQYQYYSDRSEVECQIAEENLRLENVQDEIEHPDRTHAGESDISDADVEVVIRDPVVIEYLLNLRDIGAFGEVGIIHYFGRQKKGSWEGDWEYDFADMLKRKAGNAVWRAYACYEQSYKTFVLPSYSMNRNQGAEFMTRKVELDIMSPEWDMITSSNEMDVTALLNYGDYKWQLIDPHHMLSLIEMIQ